jgi:mono/diheme cytochrome c family protein
MRYFLLGFVLLCVLVVSIAGLRYDHGGRISRKPPIEVFPDMDRQPKLRPQTRNNFFPDRLSSQLPVVGAIPRGKPTLVEGREVYAFEDQPLNTGRVPGTTNFVETIPLPVTEKLLKRGQERFQIYCAVCHGAGGDAKGVTSKYQMVGMANFHDKRLVSMPAGEIFNTITHGKNLMGAYGGQIDRDDRWAIIAYVRALQRSRLASLEDVPEAMRSTLKK